MQQNEDNNNSNNKANETSPFLSKPSVSWSGAEGINLLKNKCGVRRQAVIKVLTDQSAADSEPAIILTESNEHSKPRSAPNMKGDVICWQLGSRRGSRRGEGRRERSRESEGERSVTGQERGTKGKRGGEAVQRPACCPSSRSPAHGPLTRVLRPRDDGWCGSTS